MDPSVSFIIPVYNGEKCIAQAISSALSQNYAHFDVIVVNDGSKDQTLDILTSIRDERLKVISLEKNQGRSNARNIGVQSSNAEYIAFLDADDQIDSQKLRLQIKYMLDHKLDICGTWGHTISKEQKLLFKHPIDDKTIKSRIIKSHIFIHSSVIMRRSLFLNSGGYDKELSFSEDYDLFLRLVPFFICGNMPIPTVEYASPVGFSYAFREQKTIAMIRLRAILNYGYGLNNILFVFTPIVSFFIPRNAKIILKKFIN